MLCVMPTRKEDVHTLIFLHVWAREEWLASDIEVQEYLYDFRSKVCNKIVL